MRREEEHGQAIRYDPHKHIKRCLKLFNIVCVITGIVAICTGIWVFFDPGTFEMFHGIYKFLYPAALFIACGLLAIFLSGFGWVGLVRESKGVLKAYNILLLVAACAQIISGGIGLAFRVTIREEIKNQTLIIIKHEYGTGNIILDGHVDRLQQELRCCGAASWQDYNDSYWITLCDSTKKYVPESCCSFPPHCTMRTNSSLIHPVGCNTKLGNNSKTDFIILGSIGIVLGGLQIFGFCFSTYFYNTLNSYTQNSYTPNEANQAPIKRPPARAPPSVRERPIM